MAHGVIHSYLRWVAGVCMMGSDFLVANAGFRGDSPRPPAVAAPPLPGLYLSPPSFSHRSSLVSPAIDDSSRRHRRDLSPWPGHL